MSQIYRFMSFESFVDLVQTKSLVFANPTSWEDPRELEPVDIWIHEKLLQLEDAGLARLLEYTTHEIRKRKLYAQCWTALKESDALWRIYYHDGFAVRVSINTADLKRLDNVIMEKVHYLDNFFKLTERFDYKQIFCVKRKAFAHEKEIRLLHQYRFKDAKDLEQQAITMLMAIQSSDGSSKKNIAHSLYKNMSIEESLNDINNRMQYTFFQEPTKAISFAHIPQFIKSVMLSPFAPDWFDKTVDTYCGVHSIKYLGKSSLYKDIPEI
ncbi:MAG: hypothetical protein WC977_01835 [Anaerovoracaceae bacterium]|jgi:hypothetical protein